MTQPLRVVFCGTPPAAVPSLRTLAARPDAEMLAVLTQPDRPAGRGRVVQLSPVKQAAIELGIPVRTPEKLRDVRGDVEAMRPDVIAVVAYGHIFRSWLLDLPPLGCVNVHFSLLPRHRGVAPVAHAILAGDQVTGVTTMRMDRGVDTGATYLREEVPIHEGDTTDTLTASLAELGAALLDRTITGLREGTLAPAPQDDAGATYAARLEKEDGRVDWSRSAGEIARRVRALTPWPGTFTTFRARTLKLHEVVPRAGRADPGELRVTGERVEVGTGDGLLELVSVQFEGKSRTEAIAWSRGARPDPHERLGAAE